VGEHEAGQRLFQVAHDPRCSKSGVYWSWNGGPREGRGVQALEKGGQISGGGGAGGGWDSIFENDQSAKVLDVETAVKLFDYSTQVTGAEWPELKAITSPCPTLKVIGAVTKGMVKREELKRMRELGRPGMDGTAPIKVSKAKKVAMVSDRVASGVLKNTIGRVARFAGRRVLGEFPEEAVTGSFDTVDTASATEASSEKEEVESSSSTDIAAEAVHFEKDMELFEKEVAPQLAAETPSDKEDEALFRQIYEESKAKTDEQEKSAIEA